jgi:hypothetical protein
MKTDWSIKCPFTHDEIGWASPCEREACALFLKEYDECSFSVMALSIAREYCMRKKDDPIIKGVNVS